MIRFVHCTKQTKTFKTVPLMVLVAMYDCLEFAVVFAVYVVVVAVVVHLVVSDSFFLL